MRRFILPFTRPSRADIAADVDAELQFHFDARTAELIAGGLSRDEAAAQARHEFGDVDFTRRYCARMDAQSHRERTGGCLWCDLNGQELDDFVRLFQERSRDSRP